MTTAEEKKQFESISASVTRLSDAVERLLNADVTTLVEELQSRYETALLIAIRNNTSASANAGAGAFNFENYVRRAYYGSNGSYPTGLPVLYLYGDTYSMSKTNKVNLSYRYGDAIRGYTEGTCTCKWQGNSSLNFRKKNFTIAKLAPAINVGWGSMNKYVFKANFNDYSMARNVVAAKLWGEMVRTRTGTDAIATRLRALPNGGAIDGFPVILVVNNTFYGIYTLNLPKDACLFGMGANGGCSF